MYPEIPLHDNLLAHTPLEARQRVRKRHVSFALCTQDHIRVWDIIISLATTTRKPALSFYQYIHDRILKANQIPSLPSLVEASASELGLGASCSVAQLTPSY